MLFSAVHCPVTLL